jgi:tetratricopeptide (TPR) repeat protein
LSKAEIDRAIAHLGSSDFTVREAAMRALWNAGAEAEPALEKAVRDSDDFEVVCRARQLLQSFELGIYADTPPEVVVLIGRFRMGSLQMKISAGQGLKEKGKSELLRRLIAKETDPTIRQQLTQSLLPPGSANDQLDVPGSGSRRTRAAEASELARKARDRLAQRDFDGAEKLLGAATNDVSLRDYAALLLSQGKLDAAIAQLRVNLKRPDEAAQRRLAWMLRAKGDLAGALAAARLVKDQELVADLLAEMGEWKELAKLDAKADVEALADSPDGAPKLARIVIFRHLAGEKQACGLAAAAALKAWKQQQFQDRNLLGALALSDRVDQALEAAKSRDAGVAFELLAAQNQIREALRLVKIDVPVPAKFDWAAWLRDAGGDVSQERLSLALQVARTLGMAGEDQRAGELIDAMLAAIGKKPPEDGSKVFFALNLMQVQGALGRPEASDALAVKLLALNLNYQSNPDILISLLYRDQDTIAVLLWQALRKQFPAEDRPTALKHLRRLLTDKPDAKALEEVRSLVLKIESELTVEDSDNSPDDETSDAPAGKLLAVATLFHRYGESKLTAKYLARIPAAGVSARTLIDKGNLYAEEKQWSEAAKSYEAAWAKDRRSASAAYLLGWAQTKGGAETDKVAADLGRKRMELALSVPLADGESRYDLLRTLVRLHQDDEAARQRQWVLRLAATHDRPIVLALIETGEAAAEKPEAAGMASLWQRVAVELLGGNVFLSEARFYLQFSANGHSAHVRELLQAGKTADAIDELHRAEAVLPANLQLALDCDADLRKHGAAGEADALYGRMLERHEALCRDFPHGATYHNDLAWLAANLDRDLDKALAHAQRAVELEPQSAGILDTLAEVQFRRGDRAEAVRLAKRCLEMDPEGAHYKKQLARFEAKPPAQK